MGNKISLHSFLGGISDFADRGIAGSFRLGTNLDIRKFADTLSAGQAMIEEGIHSSHSPSASPSPSSSLSYSPSLSPSASPSPTPSPSASVSPSASLSPSSSLSTSSSTSPSPSPSAGLTTVFDDLILWFVKAIDGYTYGFSDTGSIYRRDSSGFWIRVYKDNNGKIKGAIEKPSSTGARYLEWCTDTKVKRKPLPGRTDWNDVEVVAQNLQSQDWHTMQEVGGAALIANGSFLALVGYDDSYTNEALDLIPGNLAKTLVERNGRVVVGTYRGTDPSTGINAAIDTEIPLAQMGTNGELFFADFVNSIPVKRFPGGGRVNPGGVCNQIEQANFFDWEENALSWITKQSVGNLSLWGVFGADSGTNGIYSYGRHNKNHPMTLNLDYAMDVDEIGAIASVNGTIIASYRDGSDYGVRAVDSTTKAVATYEGLELRSPSNKLVNTIPTWDTVEIFTEPMPAGASLSFLYKLNQTGAFKQAYMENGSPTFSGTNETRAIFHVSETADIFEPKLVITPTGNTSPQVRRVLIGTT